MSSDNNSNPSWSELGNFIHFLNAQLMDCEKSFYLKDSSAFKDFLVRFTILMSKVSLQWFITLILLTGILGIYRAISRYQPIKRSPKH